MRGLAKRICCVSFALSAVSGVARADMLGLTLLDSPDILASFISVDYNAANDTFAADGFSLTLDNVNFDVIGQFTLAASIDDSGALAPGGTLLIGGEVNGVGPTLLTGDLTDFGFLDAGGDLFEFTFDVTGGDLAGVYGELGGIILTLGGGGFDGTFGSDFHTTLSSFGDIAPIPAPGALLLGLIGMAMVSRAKKHAQ